MSEEQQQKRLWWKKPWVAPLAVAMVAWAAVLCTLDAVGEFPNWPEGPGLTVDENFNIQQGVYLVEAVKNYGLALLHPKSVQEVFGVPFYLPDHPPLGRLWLGVWHETVRAACGPQHFVSRFSPFCARTGSAAAFALLVLLVGWTAGRWYGWRAGLASSLAVFFMPRVFGHAHQAALETFVGLTYTAAVLALAEWWTVGTEGKNGKQASGQKTQNKVPEREAEGHRLRTLAEKKASSSTHKRRQKKKVKNDFQRSTNQSREGATAAFESPPTVRAVWLAGVVFGLALLSKIQAVLLVPPVAVWMLWHWRKRGVWLLLGWGTVAFVVFFVGWPWLWLDPLHHLLQYFGRTTNRATLFVWYLGKKYADRTVPWHYPWVLFLTTVPVGLHVLAAAGLSDWRTVIRSKREQLVLACTFFPLVVFSVPGVAVYDGARLFLVVFPLWALLVGRGVERLWVTLGRHWPQQRLVSASVLWFGLQTVGLLTTTPCYLSYYNLLVGGLRGAVRLGLEPTYWGDAVTRSLLQQLAERCDTGELVLAAPTLHQFQWQDLQAESPLLKQRNIHFQPFSTVDKKALSPTARYLLLFHRNADLPPVFQHRLPGRVVACVKRSGVTLAELRQLTNEQKNSQDSSL